MTSINFNVIGLTRPGFKNCVVLIQTHNLWIPQSSRAGGRHSTHSATLSVFPHCGTPWPIAMVMLTARLRSEVSQIGFLILMNMYMVFQPREVTSIFGPDGAAEWIEHRLPSGRSGNPRVPGSSPEPAGSKPGRIKPKTFKLTLVLS